MSQTNATREISRRIDAEAAKLEALGLGKIKDVWDQHPDNQLWALSGQEALVFDIAPERWPRMVAALRAFEEYTGFARHIDDDWPECLWDALAEERPDIPRDMENVEAFAGFCVTCAGLSAGEAYRAWHKWETWHFRMGYHYYPTHADEISDTRRLRRAEAERDAARLGEQERLNAVVLDLGARSALTERCPASPGERLAAVIQRDGLAQAEVAREAGVLAMYVSLYKSGKGKIPGEARQRLGAWVELRDS